MVTRARLSAHLAIAICVEPLEKVDDASAAGRASDLVLEPLLHALGRATIRVAKKVGHLMQRLGQLIDIDDTAAVGVDRVKKGPHLTLFATPLAPPRLLTREEVEPLALKLCVHVATEGEEC